ncbi:hypothetical protein ES703_24875 [subsurface metagenome]
METKKEDKPILYDLKCRVCKQITIHKLLGFTRMSGAVLICKKCRLKKSLNVQTFNTLKPKQIIKK